MSDIRFEKTRIALEDARKHYDELVEKYFPVSTVTTGQDIKGRQAITSEAIEEIAQAKDDKDQKEKEFKDIISGN